jgi:hypothetical protein
LGVGAAPPAPPAPSAATRGAAGPRSYRGLRTELREADAVLRIFVYQLDPLSGNAAAPETHAWPRLEASGIVVSALKGSRFAVGDTLRFSVPAADPAPDADARRRFGGFYQELPRSGREAIFLIRRADAGLEATATICLAPTILAGENGTPGRDAYRSRVRAADDRFVSQCLRLAGEPDDAALVDLTRAIFGGLLDTSEPDSARVRLFMYDWALLSSRPRGSEPAVRQIAEEYRAQILARARKDGNPFLIAWMAGFLQAEQRRTIVKAMLERLASPDLDPNPPADDPPGDAAASAAGGRAGEASGTGLAPFAIGAVVDPTLLDYGSPDFVSALVRRPLRPDSILTEARAFARR